MIHNKIIFGKEEWVSLPELGLPAVKARIDSGAKTSSLHAFNIQHFEENGQLYVAFDVHPIQQNRKISVRCKAKVVDRRKVRNSGGQTELRYVVKTILKIGEQHWEIEISLTNRDEMGYRMLLGREAMEGRVLVDPSQSFCVNKIDDIHAQSLYKVPKPTKGGLKILVLASNPALYSNQRLIEAGEQRGHEIRFINVKYCYINVSAKNPMVYYRGGELLKNIDAVIPRLRPSMTFYGCAVTRQFQTIGSFCLNDAVAIARSRDKLRSLQLLSNRGIDLPTTGFASSPHDTKALIKLVGGAPLIVKLLEGTQGKGIVLAETSKAAESVINAFKSLHANILVQEFIKEAEGRDLRCFVVDGKVVGAMERVAQEGEFRANLHLGALARAVHITPQEKRMAIRAARVMGLQVAGVDIIRSKSGPRCLEVNASPGLQGIEHVTGKDIASLMIESIERNIELRQQNNANTSKSQNESVSN